jgi:glucosamine--fructose-6-phosphate aminotransferase (isomerizing)
VHPEPFRADIEQVPGTLVRLADAIATGKVDWGITSAPRRLLLIGMGSSYFAADACARRLRAAGLDAAAERSSVAASWPPAPAVTVVAISASGRSPETLAAVEPYLGTSWVIALTNDAGSELATVADRTVAMLAGAEAGGVACRSFRHTIACLLALEAQLLGRASPAPALHRAAAATADLLERVDAWLPDVLDALDSPDGTWLLAPVERYSSALQGALMIREGPRRRADACETGDWSHVDVYLTKTLDYRALVFTGSRHEPQAARWMAERGSTAVAVGGSFPAARLEVRYEGEDEPAVAVLTEPLVAELVAAEWWRGQYGASTSPIST